MYALKVRTKKDVSVVFDASDPSRRPAGDVSDGKKPDDELVENGAFDFSAGNPRVEHITGVIHLYRDVPVDKSLASTSGAIELPEDRSERLCVLAIPSDMGFADFCQFVGAYLPFIRDMRIVRRSSAKCVYSVLLRFDVLKSADEFFKDYNGRPFSSLEPEVICRLVYVKDVQFVNDADQQLLDPLPNQTELPSCPVCLERLDQHVSGVVTTVCNHKFHNECLQRWGDTSCPVCRYCQQPGTTSHCATCGTSQDLWICLICGQVGCGRYKEGHAIDHWKNTSHCYALELETQRVWDYVGDGYVHRLIQSKTDGKLVALSAPSAAAGSDSCTAQRSAYCDSEVGSEFEEALIASKLDAIASEYNHLLVTQLESQRQYYESLHTKAMIEAEQRASEASTDSAKAAAVAHQAQHDAKQEQQKRRAAEKKLTDVSSRISKLEEEKDFLKQLNTTLLANQKDYQTRLDALQQLHTTSMADKDRQICDLQEQVRDLMVYLETQKFVSEGGSELKDATILSVPEPQKVKRRSSKKR